MRNRIRRRIIGIALMLLSQIIAYFVLDLWDDPNIWFPISITVFAVIFPIVGSGLAMAGAIGVMLLSALLLPMSMVKLVDTIPWFFLVILALGAMYFAGAKLVYRSAHKPSWWNKTPQPNDIFIEKASRLRNLDYLLIGVAIALVVFVLVFINTRSF